MKHVFLFLCCQQTLLTRGGRILALVPAENAPSDDSERSDVEEEFRVRTPLSSFSSPAPSIHSSLERLNIVDDDEHYNSKIDVDCPQIVKEYNKHMGGVDLADMLISLYKTPFKSRRWYIGIFVQILDICINNAWLLYRRDQAQSSKQYIPLKDFRYEIYEGLKKFGRADKNDKARKGVPSANPVESLRYDAIGHFMIMTTQGRCKLCQKLTTVLCMKCKVRLCFVTGKNPRNCQLDYHVKA